MNLQSTLRLALVNRGWRFAISREQILPDIDNVSHFLTGTPKYNGEGLFGAIRRKRLSHFATDIDACRINSSDNVSIVIIMTYPIPA